MAFGKTQQSNKPECYHAACQYSDDACDGCEYEMDCYEHFLKLTIPRRDSRGVKGGSKT